MTISILQSRRNGYIAILILVLLVGAALWGNYQILTRFPGGGDFLIHWVGIRGLIFDGTSPYSETTAREAKSLLDSESIPTSLDGARIVDPFYSGLLYAPFALIKDFRLANALWVTFLEILVVFTTALIIKQTNLKINLWLFPIYLLFSLFWFHGFAALYRGDAMIVVAILLVAAFAAIRNGQDILGGVYLALSTINLPVVGLLILFVVIWAISHRRWTLPVWILGWILILIISGMFFIPDWPLQNLRAMLAQPDFNFSLMTNLSFDDWFPGIGQQLKIGFTGLLFGILLLEWGLAWGKNLQHFMWVFCLTLTLSVWIGITPRESHYVILLLPVAMIFTALRERWGSRGDFIILVMLITMFFGVWVMFWLSGENQNVKSALFVPIPLLVVSGLYWIRWWILRPIRPILQDASQ